MPFGSKRMTAPIPADNFSWTAAGFWFAFLAFCGAIVRQIGPWRKQISEMEERLRGELLADRVRCEAELRVVRHRTRNQRQIIYSLLRLFDVPATKRKDMLASIRADLAAIEEAEATESAVVSTILAGDP
jgi:hypothetical protein